jgi:hypothetical protein
VHRGPVASRPPEQQTSLPRRKLGVGVQRHAPGKTRYPSYRIAPGLVWTCAEKISPPPGLHPRITKRYTFLKIALKIGRFQVIYILPGVVNSLSVLTVYWKRRI